MPVISISLLTSCHADSSRGEQSRALMISVAHQCHLSVSISASCQYSSMQPASANQCHFNATYQCLPVHINATYHCPSELPLSVTHQCQTVPPINAIQCCLSVPFSAAYQ
ncbi:unnamed protein product, partial [Staurois parvus]